MAAADNAPKTLTAHQDLSHDPVAGTVEGGLHLHSLDGEQHVAGLYGLADADGDGGDGAGHGGGDVGVVAVLGLAAGGEAGDGGAVGLLVEEVDDTT